MRELEPEIDEIEDEAAELQTICDLDGGRTSEMAVTVPLMVFGGYATTELMCNILRGPDLPGDAAPIAVAAFSDVIGLCAVMLGGEGMTERQRILLRARRVEKRDLFERASRMLRRRQRRVYLEAAGKTLAVALALQGGIEVARTLASPDTRPQPERAITAALVR